MKRMEGDLDIEKCADLQESLNDVEGGVMSEACLKQIRYWNKALQESQKGHRRKNRLIFRLRKQIDVLETDNRLMMLKFAMLKNMKRM